MGNQCCNAEEVSNEKRMNSKKNFDSSSICSTTKMEQKFCTSSQKYEKHQTFYQIRNFHSTPTDLTEINKLEDDRRNPELYN